MHGFNQGFSTIRDLCLKQVKPDLFLLQEHWLIESKMDKFQQIFDAYFCFGYPAQHSPGNTFNVGRPAGGVAILINNNLKQHCRTLFSSPNFLVVKLFSYVIVNLYLPCTGTVDRLLIIDEILNDVATFIYDTDDDCTILVGGDFNCDLDSSAEAAKIINLFAETCCLHRSDQISGFRANTYVNQALNCSSCLDYFLISEPLNVTNFSILDEGSNLSDHLPLVIECKCENVHTENRRNIDRKQLKHRYMRWDHANLANYYTLTGHNLQCLLEEVISFASRDNVSFEECQSFIEYTYNSFVNILCDSANMTVPVHCKNFYKFWWNEELDCLKEDSISSHRLWLAAGRPRCGPIANKARACKMLYKKRIREYQKQETLSYTNDLDEALNNKNGNAFWKCWRGKFENTHSKIIQVDGLSDDSMVAAKFLQHFSTCCSNLTDVGSKRLADVYNTRRPIYQGIPFDDSFSIDVELVDSSIRSLKRGKAAGLDGLSAEHLLNCHPAINSLLYRLFNLMIKSNYVPGGFGLSYTIPLPKSSVSCFSKSLSTDDFRGISISPIVSKVFEKCILERYERFLETSDSQFGFKRGLGCNHAIYSVVNIVSNFVRNSSNVNLCALDLSKAFDRMSHHGLFIKMMDRMIPNALLATLEYWFSICETCVRWGDVYSEYTQFKCGVRQGGVLSPYLFAVFIDDVIKPVQRSQFGCHFGLLNFSIILYADDILLISPSVAGLQQLIHLVENYLIEFEMSLNAKKTVCLRIGKNFKDECCQLFTTAGDTIQWANQIRYLGVDIVGGRNLKISLSNKLKSYYRSVNSIMSKLANCASEECLVRLLISKCAPILTYGLEAFELSNAHIRTLDFVSRRTFMRIFKTRSVEIVTECMSKFNVRLFSLLVSQRKENFLLNMKVVTNYICQYFAGD
jgi:exonuclease III